MPSFLNFGASWRRVISYTLQQLYTCQLYSPASLPLSASFFGHFTLVSFFFRPLYQLASRSGHSTLVSFFHRPVYPCQFHSPVTLPLLAFFPHHSTRQLHSPATLSLLASFTGQSTLVSFNLRPLYPCRLHYSVTLHFLDPVYDLSTLSRFILRQL